MKAQLLLGIIVVLCLPTRLWARTVIKTNQVTAVVAFQKITVDLGKVTPNAKATAEFKFKNTGGRDLLLTDAQPSCGCSSLQFDEVTSPQGEGKVSLAIRTPEVKGGYTELLYFKTNDPSHKLITLKINFRVESQVSMDTDEVRFESPSGKIPPVHRVSIFSSSNDFSPHDITSSSAYVKAEIEKGTNGTYSLMISLLKGVPEGILYANITFATGIPAEPQITLPVYGNFKQNRPETGSHGK